MGGKLMTESQFSAFLGVPKHLGTLEYESVTLPRIWLKGYAGGEDYFAHIILMVNNMDYHALVLHQADEQVLRIEVQRACVELRRLVAVDEKKGESIH